MQQREQLASTPEPPLPKGKGTGHLSRSPDREMRESQGERERQLGETGGSEWEHGKERMDSIV